MKFLYEPVGQCLGPVKSKDRTADRIRLQQIGESDLLAGRLVQEWQWSARRGEILRQALGVSRSLELYSRERDTILLGFNDAGGSTVEVEEVVGKTESGFKRELSDGYASGGSDIRAFPVLHLPAGWGVSRILCKRVRSRFLNRFPPEPPVVKFSPAGRRGTSKGAKRR